LERDVEAKVGVKRRWEGVDWIRLAGNKQRKAVMITAVNLGVEISSSHGGEYEVQNCLLVCTAV
jgi:hypothetical protein